MCTLPSGWKKDQKETGERDIWGTAPWMRVKVSIGEKEKKVRTTEWKLQDSQFQFNLRKLQILVRKPGRKYRIYWTHETC